MQIFGDDEISHEKANNYTKHIWCSSIENSLLDEARAKIFDSKFMQKKIVLTKYIWLF